MPSKPTDQPPVRNLSPEFVSTVLVGVLALNLISLIGVAFLAEVLGIRRIGETRRFTMPEELIPMAILWSLGFFLGSRYILRRYRLPWSSIGWIPSHHWKAITWSIPLFPVVIAMHRLETAGWMHLFRSLSIHVDYYSWNELRTIGEKLQRSYGMAGLIEITLALCLLVISQGTFLWGFLFGTARRRPSELGKDLVVMALFFLVLFLTKISLGLPFLPALIITYAYYQSVSLLTPTILVSGILLLPLWYGAVFGAP